MNQAHFTITGILGNIPAKVKLPAFTVNYLQHLLDELCKPDTTITPALFFCQFRIALKVAKKCECGQPKTASVTPDEKRSGLLRLTKKKQPEPETAQKIQPEPETEQPLHFA